MNNLKIAIGADHAGFQLKHELIEFLKTLNIGNERASYLKAIQIFDLRGYLTPEDFEKDMILEIDNIKFYSLSYLTLYIVEFDRFLSRQLGCFINQKFL